MAYSVVGARLMSWPTRSVSDVPSSTAHTPFGDGELDLEAMREIPKDRRRGQSLDDHADLGRRLLRARAARDELSRSPVPSGRRPAGDDEVAHPGEPRERVRAGAGRLGETPHLREPARDERGLRVVAEREAVRPAGGEGDDVLRRRAQLDAGDVVAHVDAEQDRVHRDLHPDRELEVVARDDGGRRQARTISSAMFGPESTATGLSRTSVESRAPVAGSRPFVRLRIGRVARKPCDDLAEDPARNGDDDELGVGDRRVGDRRGRDPVEARARRVARVPAGPVDRLDLLGIPRRERHLVAVVAQQARDGGAPRAGSDDDDSHSDVTKSMETGTPSSEKRARSSFSTQ